jgi:hypothetical protein
VWTGFSKVLSIPSTTGDEDPSSGFPPLLFQSPSPRKSPGSFQKGRTANEWRAGGKKMEKEREQEQED